MKFFIAVLLSVGVIALGVLYFGVPTKLDHPSEAPPPFESADTERELDFSTVNSIFKFSAKISGKWKIEYIPQIQAVNIYDPAVEAIGNLEKSQIFIRYFEASDFLTLSSVAILNRESTVIKNHPAVRYEILKKPGVAPFPHQPSWRNRRHQLIDIRLSGANPSTFYVFAHNPNLAEGDFDNVIRSLAFHNDRESFRWPLENAETRIAKKPFGIRVSPHASPIQPERFTGYHTGVDFEILPGEEDADVTVTAICGGKLKSKSAALGYGGVALQECLIDDQRITVIYGHIALESVVPAPGTYLAPGEGIGNLGTEFSEATDGERKHLHLGIVKGGALDLRGYVRNEFELQRWLSPSDILR